MKIIAVTQKGPKQQENEDRILVGSTILSQGSLETELTEGILAVADGVGGYPGGAEAAQLVTERLAEITAPEPEAFSRINEELLSRKDYPRMATTLAGLWLKKEKALLFSVGNTRVYRLQGGKYLKQMTTDQTAVQQLLSAGQLTPMEAEAYPGKNLITACFGGGDATLLQPMLKPMDAPSAPILITTDGIHDHLSTDQMEEILETHGLTQKAAEAMIAAARLGGSEDDASILLGIL